MDKRQIYIYDKSGQGRTELPHWYDDILFRYVPFLWLRWVAYRKHIKHPPFRLDKLLRKYKKVHIKFHHDVRGFRLELDNQVSLWFEQRGDHFEYDGWEVGDYEDGEVTVFDFKLGQTARPREHPDEKI